MIRRINEKTRNILFNAGKIHDENHLIFSSLNYNALFDCDLSTGKTKYISQFPKVNVLERAIHSSCESLGDIIYFFPLTNMSVIHKFNIITHEIEAIDIEPYEYVLNTSCIVNNTVYYFVVDKDLNMYLCNLNINKQNVIFQMNPVNTTYSHVYIKRVVEYRNMVIFSLYGESCIHIIDIEKQSISTVDLNISIFGLYVIGGRVLISAVKNNAIYEYNYLTNKCEKVFNVKDNEDGIINIIVQLKNTLIALSSKSDEVIFCDEGAEFNTMNLLDDCKVLDTKYKRFYKYDIFNNSILLFPYNLDYILQINIESRKCRRIYIEFDNSSSEYLRQLYYMRYSKKILIEQFEQQLDDYLMYIKSI